MFVRMKFGLLLVINCSAEESRRLCGSDGTELRDRLKNPVKRGPAGGILSSFVGQFMNQRPHFPQPGTPSIDSGSGQ